MKKLITAILLFMVCSVQAHSFKYSQKEELEQDIQHWHTMYPNRTKEDIYDELKTFFGSNIYEVESLNTLIARMKKKDSGAVARIVQQMQDVNDIFNDLKTKMHIPHEVDLWFIHNPAIVKKDQMDIIEEEAAYDGQDRRVYVSANFFSRVPSTRLYELIHELTHVQQHQRLGLRKFKEARSYDKEHEADTQAIIAITCPVCTQLIADEWSDTVNGSGYRPDFGYLSRKAVEQSKKNKTDEDICRAHSADIEANQQLRALMPVQKKTGWLPNWFGFSAHEKQALDRLNLDWQCSQAAEDRLSTVRFEK